MVGSLPGKVTTPTDGDTQVIRRTTTQPVRSIKGQRPAERYSHFLDHVSHINWQTCVARRSSDHKVGRSAGRCRQVVSAGRVLSRLMLDMSSA